MRFLCLKRARLAKTSVLERILDRKISDGHWIAEPGEKTQGLALFQQLRVEYQSGKAVEEILKTHPELQICYREDLKLHEVRFNA